MIDLPLLKTNSLLKESSGVFCQYLKLSVYEHEFILLLYLPASSRLIPTLSFLFFISVYCTAIFAITEF